MARILIAVLGGVVSSVISDDTGVGVYLRDYDDLAEKGLKYAPAEYIGCGDVTPEAMDKILS